jgi:hypothetical protein
MTESNKKPRIHDDPTISEAYANKVISVTFDGGALVVTLGATRMTPERLGEAPRQGNLPEIWVTGRLAVSPSAAMELVNNIQGVLAMASRASQTMTGPMPTAGKAN